jgi:phytoene dehydrogenase-like protein
MDGERLDGPATPADAAAYQDFKVADGAFRRRTASDAGLDAAAPWHRSLERPAEPAWNWLAHPQARRRDMRELLRIAGMNAYDLLTEHFSSTLLQGALGFDAVLGSNFGPRAPGTVMTLLYRMAAEHGAGGAAWRCRQAGSVRCPTRWQPRRGRRARRSALAALGGARHGDE